MLKPFKNIYFIISLVFVIWMLFFDGNSWLIHRELNKEKAKIENSKEFYKNEIKKDLKEIKELNTESGLEKFAREKYYMKKENEDIFIIEYEDSIKPSPNE